MKTNWLLGSITLGLFLTYGSSLPAEEQIGNTTSSPGYTFKCMEQNGVPVTVGFEPDGAIIAPPLIIWKSRYFEAKGFTPQRRCEVVTDKLNTVLAGVGGNPANLRLTMGKINNLRVLCYVSDAKSSCDNSNILITLSRKNKTNSFRLIAGMLRFSVAKTGTALTD